MEVEVVVSVVMVVVVVLGLELVVVVTLVACQYLVVRQVIHEQLGLHHAHTHAHVRDSAEAVLQGPHHARKTDHLEHHHGQNHMVCYDEHLWWPQKALQASDVHVDGPAEMEYESLLNALTLMLSMTNTLKCNQWRINLIMCSG
ncbi:uncharacterized protein ARMOST_20367 [Armillaria ostoyae]|uniref:Uncharacterized protein n=1 Tax=Armillaria ostoyae TaxID=47428 RepID=A0A284S754_ARMOS|nr:uncharacterized protein ARMOST_20367 [Armillaria ostoyae]